MTQQIAKTPEEKAEQDRAWAVDLELSRAAFAAKTQYGAKSPEYRKAKRAERKAYRYARSLD